MNIVSSEVYETAKNPFGLEHTFCTPVIMGYRLVTAETGCGDGEEEQVSGGVQNDGDELTKFIF
jgi:hypothetical protein